MSKKKWIKRVLVIFIALTWMISCKKVPSSPENTIPGKNPVYMTFYTHNEDTWQPWVGTRSRYMSYRENLVRRLDLIAEYQAALNWQSDLTVLQAMIRHEDDSLKALTGGKNILEYMQDLGISVDPHGHLRHCNYADLAHFIRQLGVEPSGVIGGLPFVNCGSTHLGFQELEDWQAEIELNADGTITGRLFPQATWRPTILSVPGMPGHWYDDFSSGVWQPGNDDDFYTHTPESPIVYVGQGYPHDATNLGSTQASGSVIFAQQAAYVKELVKKILEGDVPDGQMFTASIHIRDCITVADNADRVDVNTALEEILQILRPLAEDGDIVYVTYQQAVDIWHSQFNSQPCRLDFSEFSMYPFVKSQAENYCEGL